MKTNLGAARKYAGYTQQSAADALGIPVSTLRKWEQGVYEPDIGSIISFAKLYRTTADTILGTQFADSSIVSPGSSPTASSERLEVFHMTIGENIRRIRNSRSMTQEEFGKIADVSSMAVSQWENDRAVPRMGAVQRIADYFGVPKSDIIDEGSPHRFKSIFSGGSATVPLLVGGRVHAGDADNDNDPDEETIEVPASIAAAHGNAIALRVVGDCMDRVAPPGCHVLIDPDIEPGPGSPVVVETPLGELVMRRWMRGQTRLMLVADSHTPHDDIVFDGDEPVRVIGTVVWVQGDVK